MLVRVQIRSLRLLATVVAAGLVAVGCGAAGPTGAGGAPTIVVTTNILGDVVRHLVGDGAHVEVLMPPNADPHGFQASARQVAAMREADVLVVNGGGFEAGLDDTIAAARHDGVTTFTALDHVDRLGRDPHFFSDPAQMASVAAALAPDLGREVPGLDTAAYRQRAAGYVAALRTLDRDVAATLARVPEAPRKLVNNHDVFGYFAQRYGFEVVGAVVPSFTTGAQASAGDLAHLAATVRRAGVPAVFADTSAPAKLADALADDAGGHVEVVELYSESLGPPGSPGATYDGMMRTNAGRIAKALGAPA
jgi:zinc/manganese transport system substrate-binding protein